jgi:curved DNA-binding protein CbpA
MVLATDDLYQILGLEKTAALDKMSLRRAYLSRSKACHPECVFQASLPRLLIANA